MPSVDQVIKDPEFYQLPAPERQKVLQKIDPDFAGLPDNEQRKAVAGLTQKFSGQMGTVSSHGKKQPEPWKQKVSAYARPALEGAGAALGGIVGAGAGLATGPGAPVASPTLGLAGGTLGYAIGKRGADILDETLGIRQPLNLRDTAVETIDDLMTGAKYEMGGAAVGRVLGGAINQASRLRQVAGKNAPPLTKSAVEKKAGETLRRTTTESAATQRNAAEAARLEQEIPNLPKFTRGQRTGDAAAIKQERAAIRSPGEAGNLYVEQGAQANQALRGYLGNQFNGPGIDDVAGAARGAQTTLERGIQQSLSAVDQEAARLGQGAGPQEGGQLVRDALETGKKAAKSRASELFDSIPNDPIETDEIIGTIRQMRREFDPDLDAPEDMPSRIIDGIVNKITPKPPHNHGKAPEPLLYDFAGRPITPEVKPQPLGFQDLRKIRTRVLDEIRDVKGSANPNGKVLRRLEQLRGGIERTIERVAETGGESAAKYREASAFYKENVVPYNQGNVGKVLASDRTGAPKVGDASVISRFFVGGRKGADAADEFLKVAPPEAKQAVREFASQDLLSSATVNGEITAQGLNRWLAKNKAALEKFGITGEFRTIQNAQKAVDAAKGAEKEFSRSAAARLLNADPDKAIAAVFQGRNTREVARELKALVRGNPAAERGLKNSLAEHIMRQAETTQVDLYGNPVVSVAQFKKTLAKLAPAMREIYTPQEMGAILKVQRAYEVLGRNSRSPIGGGSDTGENVAEMISMAAGNVASRFATLNAAKALLKVFNKYGDDQVNALLNRAMFDPDYAQTLLAAGKRPTPKNLGELERKVLMLEDNKGRVATGAAATAGLRNLFQESPEE